MARSFSVDQRAVESSSTKRLIHALKGAALMNAQATQKASE
jgi:hypothetical protein